jgi:gas vesicle protein
MMPDIGIGAYIGVVLGLIATFLGLYAKGQHSKIKRLELEKKQEAENVRRYKKIAEASKKKADLHKQVAREVTTSSEVTRERIKRLQEKIDAAKDSEDFTITL